jgi:hypothetical protein
MGCLRLFFTPCFCVRFSHSRCRYADSYGPSMLIISESTFITSLNMISLLSLLICRLMTDLNV